MGRRLQKFQEISDGIANALSNAVISGDYSQFKKAIYSMVLENAINAIVESGVIADKVESLVQKVLGAAKSSLLCKTHMILLRI